MITKILFLAVTFVLVDATNNIALTIAELFRICLYTVLLYGVMTWLKSTIPDVPMANFFRKLYLYCFAPIALISFIIIGYFILKMSLLGLLSMALSCAAILFLFY
jgi:hypothetical protein